MYDKDGSPITGWSTMYAEDGAFDEITEVVTATLSGLQCGEYEFSIRGYDFYDNMSNTVSNIFTLYVLSSISGIVEVAGSGVGGVTVILYELNENKEIVKEVGTTQSAPDGTPGHYEFKDLPPDDYRLGIVTPLGFSPDEETKDVNVPICGNDETVDFTLTPVTITNNARSKGYWKNQFDYYLRHKGNAQETLDNLNSYIAAIGGHYIPHFTDIFVENYNLQYWSDILSYGGPDMYQKAKAQLAALILNMASLKISQLEVVTADGSNVADVITHASTIMSNPSSTKNDLELAKDISEAVCTHVEIAEGIVPHYNMLYKSGMNADGTVTEYSLSSNYPNPFNPSTVISYALPQSGLVTLKVYDILGNEVATLVNEVKSEGIHSVNFDASGLPSGVYIYKMQAGDFVQTKKMMLLK